MYSPTYLVFSYLLLLKTFIKAFIIFFSQLGLLLRWLKHNAKNYIISQRKLHIVNFTNCEKFVIGVNILNYTLAITNIGIKLNEIYIYFMPLAMTLREGEAHKQN